MRFWDHPEAPLVDVYWYFTDLPFLPFPTIFNSRDWCEDPWHYTGRGEVFGAPRPYDGMLVVAGLQGGHYCGTREDFENGPSWPPTGEPLVYGPDGIPTCCPRFPVGRVTSGSRPASLVVYPYVTARASSSSRPASTISTATDVVSQVRSGSRPGSTVTDSPVILGEVTSDSRPLAIVLYVPVVRGEAASASRPASTVIHSDFVGGNATSASRPASDVSWGDCPLMTTRCDECPSTMVDHECSFFDVADLPLWRKYRWIAGHTYRIYLDFTVDSIGEVRLWRGAADECGFLTALFDIEVPPDHFELDTVAVDDWLFFEVTIPLIVGLVGTIRVVRLD